ncbi:MAG: carboxypeptidase-like regulatory domain-containing protein [Polyangiaceae bacterium]
MLSTQPREGSARKWALVSFLVLFAIGITIAIFLDLRRRKDSEVTPAVATALPTARSGYQNRGFWDGPSAGRPAARPKVHGTVYDTDGHPLTGARVAATTFQMAGNQSSVIAAAESDSVGRFELFLPDGTYYLNVSKKGYGPSIAMAHAGEEVGIVLRASGVVEGRVLDDKGQPVPKFTIDVIGPGADDMAAAAPFATRTFEGPDGSYRLDEIPRQGVFLRATAPGLAPAVSSLVSVAEGKTEKVDLTLTHGCAMSGIVTDTDGTPLNEVYVDAELRRAAGVIGDSSVDAQSQAESDEGGRFTLSNVPVGDVVIRAYDGAHAATSVEMHVDGCDKIGQVTIQMAQGSSLSGVVKTSDGKPVPHAKLTLSHRSTGFVDTMSDDQGRYRFDKLPSGGLRVEAQADGQRVMAMVMMNPGQAANQDMVLPPSGKGEIHGTVTAGGKPMSGVQLMIASNVGSGSMGLRRPVTGPDGSFKVTDLPDGLYVVIVSATGQLAQAKVDKGDSQAIDIDVAKLPERGQIPKVPPRDKSGMDSDRAAPEGQSPAEPDKAPGQDGTPNGQDAPSNGKDAPNEQE